MFENIKLVDVLGFSLVNYPGHPCTVIFTAGCNLRCPWCHNWRIAYGDKSKQDRTKQVLERLKDLSKYMDAVCVTGGEPTIHADLVDVLKLLRKWGYIVKLDTNGTKPEILEKALPFLNYVALDIKAHPDNYPKFTGMEENVWWKVEASLNLLRKALLPHELRMVKVPDLTTDRDVAFLKKIKREGELSLPSNIESVKLRKYIAPPDRHRDSASWL